MARHFATGDSLSIGPGAATGTKAHTIVMLLRRNAGNASAVQGMDSATRRWSLLFDTGKPFGSGDFGAGGPLVSQDTWYVVAETKASGSQPYRYHVVQLGVGAWTHQSSTSNVANGQAGLTSIDFGLSETTGGNVDLAAFAEYGTVLSDAAIEALGFTAMDDWLAASPRVAVQFNQATTADPVTDLTGGSANQTAIVGTSVVADPAGWSYAGGAAPAEGTANVGLTLDVAAAGSRASAGTAGIGLELAVAATGERPSASTANVGLVWDVAATGQAPGMLAEGTADVGLVLTVAAAGFRNSSGTTDFGVAWNIAAAGTAPSIEDGQGTTNLGLALTVAAAGGRPSDGAASLGLTWDLAAAGSTPHTGTADLGLNLAVDAAGPAPPGGTPSGAHRPIPHSVAAARAAPTATGAVRPTATITGRVSSWSTTSARR